MRGANARRACALRMRGVYARCACALRMRGVNAPFACAVCMRGVHGTVGRPLEKRWTSLVEHAAAAPAESFAKKPLISIRLVGRPCAHAPLPGTCKGEDARTGVAMSTWEVHGGVHAAYSWSAAISRHFAPDIVPRTTGYCCLATQPAIAALRTRWARTREPCPL